jgi:hypothetical protein
MFISLTNSRSIGFKKWSDQHPHGSNNDDQAGEAIPNAATSPPIDGLESSPDSTRPASGGA